MVLTTPGWGYAGGGAGGNLDLHIFSSEKNLTVYCDLYNIISVSGGGVVPRGMITKEVVRKWGDILGGYVGVSEGERGGGDGD